MSGEQDPRRTVAWQKLRKIVRTRGAEANEPCVRCGQPINYALSGRDRWGPTVDHLSPIGLGADALPDPSRLGNAHRACNSSAGATLGNRMRGQARARAKANGQPMPRKPKPKPVPKATQQTGPQPARLIYAREAGAHPGAPNHPIEFQGPDDLADNLHPVEWLHFTDTADRGWWIRSAPCLLGGCHCAAEATTDPDDLNIPPTPEPCDHEHGPCADVTDCECECIDYVEGGPLL